MQEVGEYERSVRLLGATFRVVFTAIEFIKHTRNLLSILGIKSKVISD